MSPRKRSRRKGKRANGEGSVFQLDDGRWKAVLQTGTKIDGTRIRKSRIRKSHADALVALDELKTESIGGISGDAKALTLSAYLSKWLKEFVAKRREPTTYANYESAANLHISPHLGAIVLGRLRAADVQSWLSKLDDSKVGASAIQNAYVALRSALNQAYLFRMIPFNPCEAVDSPKVERKKIDPFDSAEALRILEAAADHRLHAVHCCGLLCGMRQGEIFGLEWPCVDFENAKLEIRQQVVEVKGKLIVKKPKSAAGIRTIDIPPRLLAALQERRRLAMKEGHAKSPLVFCNNRGELIRRSGFRVNVWKPLLKKLGLKYRGPHHCRHTYATLTLGDGVDVIVVSKVLGHANPSTTLNIYGHVIKSKASDAVLAIHRIIG